MRQDLEGRGLPAGIGMSCGGFTVLSELVGGWAGGGALQLHGASAG